MPYRKYQYVHKCQFSGEGICYFLTSELRNPMKNSSGNEVDPMSQQRAANLCEK